jgi:hypothetical protein
MGVMYHQTHSLLSYCEEKLAIAAEAGAEIVYLGAIDTEVQHVKSISTWQDQLRELRSLW